VTKMYSVPPSPQRGLPVKPFLVASHTYMEEEEEEEEEGIYISDAHESGNLGILMIGRWSWNWNWTRVDQSGCCRDVEIGERDHWVARLVARLL